MDLNFLSEIGLTDNQITIYEYLLNNKFGSINQIKNEINLSYSQVRNNLKMLESKGLIYSSKGDSAIKKSKVYFISNPKVTLMKIYNKKNEIIANKIKKLDEDLQAKESSKGICNKTISFYHYSDLNLGIENLYNLMENATEEIILTSLPPKVLKKLEPLLYNAYMRGISLKLYYSLLDFENIINYFKIITDILKNIKIILFEIKEKVCRNVRFNDLIVNEGLILIDKGYFNSILFIDDIIFHFNGFYGPGVVKQAKEMLKFKTPIKTVEIKYPKPIQNILDIINENELIKTRDISQQSKIGGGKLRQILEYLIREGIIKEQIIKDNKAGRPKQKYSIIKLE